MQVDRTVTALVVIVASTADEDKADAEKSIRVRGSSWALPTNKEM